jgi:hypothetical protein
LKELAKIRLRLEFEFEFEKVSMILNEVNDLALGTVSVKQDKLDPNITKI